jgi:hypothetical protein
MYFRKNNVIKCNLKKTQNDHHPPQTRNTQDKLLTALSCHVQNDTVLRGRKLHAVGTINIATVPLMPGGALHFLRSLQFNIQGVYRILSQLPRSTLV